MTSTATGLFFFPDSSYVTGALSTNRLLCSHYRITWLTMENAHQKFRLWLFSWNATVKKKKKKQSQKQVSFMSTARTDRRADVWSLVQLLIGCFPEIDAGATEAQQSIWVKSLSLSCSIVHHVWKKDTNCKPIVDVPHYVLGSTL